MSDETRDGKEPPMTNETKQDAGACPCKKALEKCLHLHKIGPEDRLIDCACSQCKLFRESLSSPCPLEVENELLRAVERSQHQFQDAYAKLEAERDRLRAAKESDRKYVIEMHRTICGYSNVAGTGKYDKALAALKGAVEALEPFKRFHEAIKAKPIRGLDPEDIYAIHGGDHVEGGTSLKWSDCERAATALSAAKDALK